MISLADEEVSGSDAAANESYINDHNHPLFRLTFGVRLMTGRGASPDSETVFNSYTWAQGGDLPRTQVLRAALGAAFDHCRECMSRQSAAVAEDPPLVVCLHGRSRLKLGLGAKYHRARMISVGDGWPTDWTLRQRPWWIPFMRAVKTV